jgi:hypothetical protein
MRSAIELRIPVGTTEWLLAEDNPAVSVLTRRLLLQVADDSTAASAWSRRNDYAPVAEILRKQRDDGSWAPPERDYQKYGGSLWQIHLLGELWANGDDERVRRGAEYAFRRQLPDGSWSCWNMQPSRSIPCLTANVGRALARLGYAGDERVRSALDYCIRLFRDLGAVDCRLASGCQLNGYCHMVIPKLLLFLAEIPRGTWPDGAAELRDECIGKLREKSISRSLPVEARAFNELLRSASASDYVDLRERFLAEHPILHYQDKPGWLRFGFPLSYNSDTLEALYALSLHDEPRRPEYEAALNLAEAAGDANMQWSMRNSLNGKMLADIETRGAPSKWLTHRALLVLMHFSRHPEPANANSSEGPPMG